MPCVYRRDAPNLVQIEIRVVNGWVQRLVALALITICGATLAGSQDTSVALFLEFVRGLPVGERSVQFGLALERWPADEGLVIEASKSYISSGEYEKALETLASLNPESTESEMIVLNLRGIALLRLGRTTDALDLLRPEAIRSRAVRRFSTSLQLYIHGLIDAGITTQAQRYLNLVSTWEIDSSYEQAFLVQKARMAAVKGDGAGALEALSASLRIKKDPQLQVFHALVNVWLGHFNPALADVDGMDASSLPIELENVPTLLRLLVNADTNKASDFEGQIRQHELEQSGYLLLAALQWTTGDQSALCATLKSGKDRSRSTTLLSPIWAGNCGLDVTGRGGFPDGSTRPRED